MRVNLDNRSGFTLSYKTGMSAGLDVVSTENVTLPPGKVVAVPTGLWIKDYDLENSMLGELQVRARSSMAYKNNIILANGVGTVDLDYPEEIKLLLLNLGDSEYTIKVGDRIGQLVLNAVDYITGNDIQISEDARVSGFGSTGR